VLTPRGTLPAYQLRVLRPKETAWAKDSWPRRMPQKRAGEIVCQLCTDYNVKLDEGSRIERKSPGRDLS